MRWRLALAVLAGLAVVTGAVAATQSVSLTVVRTKDQNTGLWTVRFSGSISSGAAGELVTVLQQTCGYRSSTSIAAAETRSGGGWDAQPATPASVAMSATYRARWRNELSPPVRVRPPIEIFLFPSLRGGYTVRMTIGSVIQNMSRREVLLQRKRKGTWTTVRRARLRADGAGGAGFAYAGTFSRVPRGWTIRARVPAKTAAPCFKTGTSEERVVSS
jgi:hypothetical protein